MAARPTAAATAGSTRTKTTGPSSSVTSTVGSSSSQERSQTVRNTNTQNMTDTALSALDNLILGLTGGKTTKGFNNPLTNLNSLQGQYTKAVTNAAQLQSDYSKGNAFKDSQAAVSATMAEALEQAMPQITAGIDSAGTSGSALSALLTQRAARDASREAAKLGIDAAIGYGNINVAAGQTSAGLLSNGDPVVNALLTALNTAKGAVQNTTDVTTGTASSSGQSSSVATTVNSGDTTTVTEQPATGVVKKKGTWEAPKSSAVTSNTGSGWQTTYGV